MNDDALGIYAKNSANARKSILKINELNKSDMQKSKMSDVRSKIMDVHNRIDEHLDDPKKDEILQKYLTMKNKLSF